MAKEKLPDVGRETFEALYFFFFIVAMIIFAASISIHRYVWLYK